MKYFDSKNPSDKTLLVLFFEIDVSGKYMNKRQSDV